MEICNTPGCGSYALNVGRKSGRCDVCFYRIPLLAILKIANDGNMPYAKSLWMHDLRDEEEAFTAFVEDMTDTITRAMGSV